MKITGYLIIGKNKALRVTKTPPGLTASEIALNLNITVPDRFFTRPTADIVIDIPDAMIMPTEAAVDVIAERVAGELNLNVSDVIDGLKALTEQAANDA